MLLTSLHLSSTIAPGQGSVTSYQTLQQYRAAGYKFHFLTSDKSFETFYRLGWRPENSDCLLNVSPTLYLSHCLSYEKALSYLSPLHETCEKLYYPMFEPKGEAVEIMNLCLLLISMVANICFCLKNYSTRPTATAPQTYRICSKKFRSKSQKPR